MRKHTGAAVALLALAASCGWAFADEGVTPEEVISKVREAATYLAREGKAGLADFERADGPWVWKDTYVFVWDCAADVVAAHPVAASRGLKLSPLKDADGKAYGGPLCEAAKKPNGSWGEYRWPKPVKAADGGLAYSEEAFRKVSYMHSVEGQRYQVGAGIYNDPTSLAELDALTAE